MKYYECKYKHSDCKGNHEDDCANFSKKGAGRNLDLILNCARCFAVNYPQRIRELEVVKFENSKLKSENEKWRIDFEANAEAYDIQGKQLLEALDEIEKLKEENVEQKFPCNFNCDECTEKCRAWQNGYNYDRPQSEIIGTKALI